MIDMETNKGEAMNDVTPTTPKKTLPRCLTCGKAVRGRYIIDAPKCRTCENAQWNAEYDAQKKVVADAFAAHPVGEVFTLPTTWGTVREYKRETITAFGSAPRVVELEKDPGRDCWLGGYVGVRFHKSNTGIIHGNGGRWVERHGRLVPCHVTKLNRNTGTVVGWYDELKAKGYPTAQ